MHLQGYNPHQAACVSCGLEQKPTDNALPTPPLPPPPSTPHFMWAAECVDTPLPSHTPLPVYNAALVQVRERRHNLRCVQPRNILVKHTLHRGEGGRRGAPAVQTQQKMMGLVGC